MVLSKSRDVVLPESRPVRGGDESWSEALRRRFVECPQCAEVWLVAGARENDRHVCKGCGHGFAISFPDTPEDDPSPVGRGGT
jgi:hypothetical protein